MSGLDPDRIVALLGLKPHPEGGCYAETFRDESGEGRAASTAIYYLLRRGERSHWHRVDAAEAWHFHAGAPLRLSLTEREGGEVRALVLGVDLERGERPQAVVPKGWWQAAESLGDWSLVGCTVAPGFEFSGFEMAPEGWSP
ncbi:MAG: cupin domain-containing protein [Proteobacteria bacterium]|nr:cupin domain-containing protein [Pseudomonadota bacterium]